MQLTFKSCVVFCDIELWWFLSLCPQSIEIFIYWKYFLLNVPQFCIFFVCVKPSLTFQEKKNLFCVPLFLQCFNSIIWRYAMSTIMLQFLFLHFLWVAALFLICVYLFIIMWNLAQSTIFLYHAIFKDLLFFFLIFFSLLSIIFILNLMFFAYLHVICFVLPL